MRRDLAVKLLLLAAVAALVAAFFAFDLGQYLTLDYLKASRGRFAALYAEHTLAVAACYFAAYVAVTALSLPGATVMTLAGGALFGFWTGFAVISFASSIGATLAFLLSRYLLGGWVQARFGDKLTRINQGVAREGAFYLFSLRLVPLFPFFVINLAMGLTNMRARTYYWVSQLGMIPGTMAYVNAGKQLGEIDSLSGILSPGVLASFAVLGLLPISLKKLLAFLRARRGQPGSAGNNS